MRITRNMLMSLMNYDLSTVQRKLFYQQMKISANKRLLAPSDDPIGTHHALNMRTAIAKNEQFQRNITYATKWLEFTESTINDINTLLVNVNVAANKAATDINSASERHHIAEEISQHIDDLLELAKTTFDGKYIFGGQQTKSSPYISSNEVTGENFTAQSGTAVELNNVHIKEGTVVVTDLSGGITYSEGVDYEIDYEDGTITVLNGSMVDGTNYAIDYETESISSITVNPAGANGTITRQIGEDTTIKLNVPAESLFSDVFDTLIELRNKIERDDTAGILNVYNNVETALERIVDIQGEVGAKINRLTLAQEFLENENVNLKDFKAEQEDLDVADAMMKFQTLNLAYQAALSTSNEIMKTNILNFI